MTAHEKKLAAEVERLRDRIRFLEREQRQGAQCVRALLKARKDAREWLAKLEPRKYLGGRDVQPWEA